MTKQYSWIFPHYARPIPKWAGMLLLMGSVSLHADLTVYEGFDYPPGDLVGQAGGTGWNQSWHGVDGANARGLVVADSLKSSPAIMTNGGHMQTNEGDTPLLRELASPLFKGTGVTWISFLATNGSGQTDSTYGFLKFAAVNGSDDGSIRIGKGFYGKNWELVKGSQTQDLGVASDSAVVLFVLRIESTGKPGNDSIQVFVNPTTASAPTSPTGTIMGLTLTPLDEVAIQSGNGTKAFGYDEIRIGTTFADVVPASTASPATNK